ncbi:hypothetical protein F5Y10DRAFT_286217 [Nemania abortiva]|nr:hypothetical protein F5Y10DRAFT_286217 [Nemania abortiva]
MVNSSGIGRLQAALASATNEVTVAAANLNFDFSLVKCEAPREYQSIGQSLTPYRKAEAEGGSQHVTARRLGALFEGACPNVPNLLRAFGTRAAEISQDSSTQSQYKLSENWIFSDYTGIDSTSLWAAATSSKAALPVYLLACMLARAWDDADATSLWVEIVAERRRAIAARYQNEEEMPFATVMAAAQAEITRDQLAKWDASARAWLRTADMSRVKQRKQFLLIANNVSMPINNEDRTFESIIVAWTTALEAMDKLIIGEPLAVKNGAILLGISAWHIYPDMDVFSGGDGTKSVDMKDSLVHPGGVVSLGLSDSSLRASQGVYWSLSLAKHKFYGRATRKTSKLNGHESRLTFNELQMVVMGVILSKWKIGHSDTFATLEFLQKLFLLIPYDPSVYAYGWIQMIVTPIVHFLQDEASAAPLLSLGRRRDGFISSPEHGPEQLLFGLTDLNTILTLIKLPSDRIDLLRRLASRIVDLERVEAYIVYYDTSGCSCLATVCEVFTRDGKPAPGKQISPVGFQRGNRTEKGHYRWTDKESATGRILPPEKMLPAIDLPFRRFGTTIRFTRSSRHFSFLFGDPENSAVYVFDEITEPVRQSLVPSIEYSDILWCIKYGLLSPIKVLSFLNSHESPIIDHLLALDFVSHIYEPLTKEGATISPRILTAPFKLEMLTNTAVYKQPPSQTVEEARSSRAIILRDSARVLSLAMIAYFETGFEILTSSEQLEQNRILGISAGDSIFVPSELLHDPCVNLPSYRFCRLLGNLGRPGLTILTDPEQPEAREIDPGSFRHVIGEFDGAQIDCFKNTSLHLSFTEWSAPLYNSSAVGQRDSQAVHAEAVVSVRDRGSWVADISILGAFSHQDVLELPVPSEPCNHPQPSKPPAVAFSLETWDQILDCPVGVLVIRSSKNWIARIAIVAVLAQHCRLRSKRIYICPENTCWDCVQPLATNVIYVY